MRPARRNVRRRGAGRADVDRSVSWVGADRRGRRVASLRETSWQDGCGVPAMIGERVPSDASASGAATPGVEPDDIGGPHPPPIPASASVKSVPPSLTISGPVQCPGIDGQSRRGIQVYRPLCARLPVTFPAASVTVTSNSSLGGGELASKSSNCHWSHTARSPLGLSPTPPGPKAMKIPMYGFEMLEGTGVVSVQVAGFAPLGG
jgi:hypothetical protein